MSFLAGTAWLLLILMVFVVFKVLFRERRRLGGKSQWKPTMIKVRQSHKPYYLFFDTETTGLAKDADKPASDDDNWPRLVQLSWILTEKDGTIVKKEDHIIRPVGFTIPQDAFQVHGISTEAAKSLGDNLGYVLGLFAKDCYSSCLCIGHNVQFDKKVVGSEYLRLGRNDAVAFIPSADTMKSSKFYCRIEGRNGRYKMPTLQELYEFLFSANFSGAHDSMSDVKATMDCFFELKRREVLIISE